MTSHRGSESDDAMPIDRTTLSSTNRHGDQSTSRASSVAGASDTRLLDASGSDMNVDESVVAGDMSQSTAHGTSSTGLDIGSGTTSASSIKPVQLTVARFDQIRNQLRMIRQRHYSSQGQDDTLQSELSLVDVMGQINHGMAGSQQIGLPELLTVVTRMSDENMGVWYQSDTETLMFI
ncbi:hypothetical protein BASA83_013274 [Batrachochytrium salamandrivorans]|nr:hypothetical protein BASA83_013274 [Batrachochytrium salamandrivorans]